MPVEKMRAPQSVAMQMPDEQMRAPAESHYLQRLNATCWLFKWLDFTYLVSFLYAKKER